MKKTLVLICVFMSLIAFSQEKLLKQVSTTSNEIEILTYGLDDVVIENANNNQVEVMLFDENPNTHAVLLNEVNGALKIEFKLNFESINEGVFRKYITKRLERARAVIKIPKNKNVVLYGKSIGVTSKGIQSNLSVYIDKGNVRLHEVKKNVAISLFLGNVYATVKDNFNINVKTNKGNVFINDKKQPSFYQKENKNALYTFKVNSIKANVFLLRK